MMALPAAGQASVCVRASSSATPAATSMLAIRREVIVALRARTGLRVDTGRCDTGRKNAVLELGRRGGELVISVGSGERRLLSRFKMNGLSHLEVAQRVAAWAAEALRSWMQEAPMPEPRRGRRRHPKARPAAADKQANKTPTDSAPAAGVDENVSRTVEPPAATPLPATPAATISSPAGHFDLDVGGSVSLENETPGPTPAAHLALAWTKLPGPIETKLGIRLTLGWSTLGPENGAARVSAQAFAGHFALLISAAHVRVAAGLSARLTMPRVTSALPVREGLPTAYWDYGINLQASALLARSGPWRVDVGVLGVVWARPKRFLAAGDVVLSQGRVQISAGPRLRLVF